MTFRGTAWNSPERIGTVCDGRSVINMLRFSAAHWPISPSANLYMLAMPVSPVVSERRQQRHA